VRFTRFSIIGILMAVLLGALAILPAAGGTAATIALDEDWVAPDGGSAGTVTVTVTDADLNLAIAATQAVSATFAAAGATNYVSLEDTEGQSGTGTFGDGAAAGDTLSSSGLSISSASAGEVADYVVSVLSSATGRISIAYIGAATPGAVNIVVAYELATVNTTTVGVESTVGNTTVSVTLSEVDADGDANADTGIFEGTFIVASHASTIGGADSDGADTITGKAGDVAGVITVEYEDLDPEASRSTTIKVEDTDPVGSTASPADDARTTDLTPLLSAQFTDYESGVVEDSVTIVVTGPVGVSLDGVPTRAAVSGGFSVEQELQGIADDTTTSVTWNVTASDEAGNTVTFDDDGDDFTLVIDNQSPTLNSAVAGQWFDTDEDVEAVNTDVTEAVNTSISVTFSEALDATTVAASDFLVDGVIDAATGATLNDVVPLAVQVFADADTIVFLTMAAMNSASTPEIDLVSGVSDAAGNSLASIDPAIEAVDGIAPGATITVSSSLVAGGTDVEIDIVADEVVSTPVVTLNGIAQSGVSLVAVATNSYQLEFDTDDEGDTDGLYAVEILLIDTAGNQTNLGEAEDSDDLRDDGYIFEVDTAIPAPTTAPAADGSLELAEPLFVTLTFTAEGAEYGAPNTGGGADVVAAGTGPDGHADVTITAADLDGVDVLSSVSTRDDVVFDAALLGVAVGDHTLSVTATDDAGNSAEFELDFEVTEREAYEVALNAGWNLVSLPGDPRTSGIDSVLPATHPATDVLQFENGMWKSAARGVDRVWEGDLTDIDSSHGYWINTTSTEPLASVLDLAGVGTAQRLPSIKINADWNLIGVIDLAQIDQGTADGADADTLADDTRTGDDYFTSIDWKVAYTYASDTRAWTRIIAGSGVVSNGQGVWVWADDAGTLIP
jgi:hypothetical protein